MNYGKIKVFSGTVCESHGLFKKMLHGKVKRVYRRSVVWENKDVAKGNKRVI